MADGGEVSGDGGAAGRAGFDQQGAHARLLQTLHHPPRRRGKRIDPGAITGVGLLAIEGERDDISGIGQTKAALDIAVNLPEALKKYHIAEGAGHYGIFSGRRWRELVYPQVKAFILEHQAGLKPAAAGKSGAAAEVAPSDTDAMAAANVSASPAQRPRRSSARKA